MSKTSRSVRLTAAHRGLEPSPHDLRSAEPTLVPVRAPPRRLADAERPLAPVRAPPRRLVDAERPLAPVRAPPHGLQSVPGTVRLQRPASYTRARVVHLGGCQPRCMASQMAVVSRTPRTMAEAQWRTQVERPSRVPDR